MSYLSSGSPPPRSARFGFGLGTAIAIFAIIVICAGLYGCPQYNVYSQRLQGEADLAKAQYSKQVLVQEAQARLDSSKLLAEVAIQQAKGVAAANKIIGDSLRGEEGANYLRYLWIDKFDSTRGQIIYFPTEGSLPMFLEAGRVGQKQ